MGKNKLRTVSYKPPYLNPLDNDLLVAAQKRLLNSEQIIIDKLNCCLQKKIFKLGPQTGLEILAAIGILLEENPYL